MNAEEITQLPSLLEDVQELFDVTIRDWDTEPVDLKLSTDYNRLIVNINRSL